MVGEGKKRLLQYTNAAGSLVPLGTVAFHLRLRQDKAMSEKSVSRPQRESVPV